MAYEILSNEQILVLEEIISISQPNGKAVIKIPYKGGAMERKISYVAPKTTITAGEVLEITFQWQKFSLEAEAYQDDPSADPITFQVSGKEADTLEPVNGQDTLTFSSLEPGTYTIKTLNAGVDNAALEVTVNA